MAREEGTPSITIGDRLVERLMLALDAL